MAENPDKVRVDVFKTVPIRIRTSVCFLEVFRGVSVGLGKLAVICRNPKLRFIDCMQKSLEMRTFRVTRPNEVGIQN